MPYNRAMLVLAVDTSGITGSLAIAKDADILGVVSTTSDEAYSSRIFRQLEFLLAELKVGLPEFDLFAVTAGPGSFTGLRVGLAAVKGWAEVYEKPIAAVGVLEAVAVQALAKEGMVAAILDGRRGQIFGALYAAESAQLREVIPACVLNAEEFLSAVEAQAGNERLTIATTKPSLFEAAQANSRLASARVVRVSPVLAPSVAQIGIARASRGELTNSLELDANYIRRSDAEVLWKAQ